MWLAFIHFYTAVDLLQLSEPPWALQCFLSVHILIIQSLLVSLRLLLLLLLFFSSESEWVFKDSLRYANSVKNSRIFFKFFVIQFSMRLSRRISVGPQMIQLDFFPCPVTFLKTLFALRFSCYAFSSSRLNTNIINPVHNAWNVAIRTDDEK